MANEITWAAIKSDAERTLMVGEIIKALADEYAVTNHEALIWGPDVSGTMTDTVTIDEDDLESGGTLTSIAEGGTFANTALGTDRYTSAVAQRYTQWNVSDLAAMVSNGKLAVDRFVRSLITRYGLTVTDLLATAGATFTAALDAGAGEPDMVDLFDAIGELEGAYVSPSKLKMAIVHPNVGKALRRDSLFAQQMNVAMLDPAVQAFAKAFGGVYLGRFQNTDVFTSFKIAVDAGKYQNIIFGRGAVLLSKGTPKVATADQVVLEMMLMEQARSQTKPETTIRGSTFLGVDVAQDASGLLWTTTVP